MLLFIAPLDDNPLGEDVCFSLELPQARARCFHRFEKPSDQGIMTYGHRRSCKSAGSGSQGLWLRRSSTVTFESTDAKGEVEH
jgi:hypothetical protein